MKQLLRISIIKKSDDDIDLLRTVIFETTLREAYKIICTESYNFESIQGGEKE